MADQGPPVRSAYTFPLVAYALALVVRLIPVLLTRDLGIGLDDMFQYDMLARSLAAGDGYRWYSPEDLAMMLNALERYAGVDVSQVALPDDPRGLQTSFRAPLYPAFLALSYRLVSPADRFFAARVIQSFVAASLAPLSFALTLRLGAARRWARIAAYIAAFWPLLVLFPLGLITENLFVPLLAAGTLMLFRAARGWKLRDVVLAAACLGLAALTRSVIIGFPLMAVGWMVWRGRRREAVVFLGVLAVLVVPWSVRNSRLHGAPTFLETSLGYNLYLGYHPEGDGSFLFGPSLDLVTILDDAERDAQGRRLAWGFIQDDPGRVPTLMIRKVGHFWGLEDRALAYFYTNGLVGSLPGWALLAVYFAFVLPLILTLPPAILGWASGLPEGGLAKVEPEWAIMTLLLVWYVGVHALIMAEERFHLALVPSLAALAARGLTEWRTVLAGLQARRPRELRVAAVAGLLFALALVNWGHELYANAGSLAVLFGPDGWQAGFNY